VFYQQQKLSFDSNCVYNCRDVATKIKDTATSAIESLTTPKQQTPVRRQDQRAAPLYKPEGRKAVAIAIYN
jgi:hypothetical protein